MKMLADIAEASVRLDRESEHSFFSGVLRGYREVKFIFSKEHGLTEEGLDYLYTTLDLHRNLRPSDNDFYHGFRGSIENLITFYQREVRE